MKKDFHYGVIKILAIKAGLSDKESEIVAYASQYVDDATKYYSIEIKNIPKVIKEKYSNRINGDEFDPICTAHTLIQDLNYGINVQRGVYIPFHFIPPILYKDNDNNYSFLVQPNSKFANKLVDNAIERLLNEKSDQNFIKLGIALHTYADTWAHQDFSGRENTADNDIENIELINDSHWFTFITQFLPHAGHAEALDYPDTSALHWKYVKTDTQKNVNRKNWNLYLEAAEYIFNKLKLIAVSSFDFSDFKDILELSLKNKELDADERLKDFRDKFSPTKFNYDEKQWEDLAYRKAKIDYYSPDQTDTDFDDQFNMASESSDLKWYLFHVEAYAQRNFVYRNIKKDLI